MRILSLNINNFGGFEQKPMPDEYNKNRKKLESFRNNPSRVKTAEEIIERIFMYNPEIIIFHEFDINSNAGNSVFKRLEQAFYIPVFPHGKKAGDFIKSVSSITLIFVKNKELISLEFSYEDKCYRWNQIQYDNYIITGVHIPYDEKYWNMMIDFYKNNNSENLIFVGDFNVSDNPAPHNEVYKRKLMELVEEGAKDAWLEKKYLKDSPTYIGKTRIDYAILSPKAYEQFCNINIDSEFMYRSLTDHAALILDFN